MQEVPNRNPKWALAYAPRAAGMEAAFNGACHGAHVGPDDSDT